MGQRLSNRRLKECSPFEREHKELIVSTGWDMRIRIYYRRGKTG